MMEGYIVYELFYDGNEYIKKIENTPGVVVRDEQHDKDKREEDLCETNGKRCMTKSTSLTFCQIFYRANA